MKRALLGLSVMILLLGGIGAALVLREASTAPAGEAPSRVVTAETPPAPGESRIALTAKIPLAQLEQVVRAKLPPTVVEMKGEPAKGDWRYDLTVLREGEPQVRGDASGRLVVEVPLGIQGRAYRGRRADRRVQRGAAPTGIRLEAGIALTLTIDYRVGSDWTVEPEVQIAHRWTGEPKLELGPLSLRVKKPIEKKLQPKLDEAAVRIRTQLIEQDTLRDKIEQTWADLHQPRALEGGTGWLQLEPRSLAMRSPRVQGDSLVIPVALVARIAVVAGQPPVAPRVAPLPERVAPHGEEGLQIAAQVELPWTMLEARAQEALWQKTWESELGELQVRRVQIYPSGDRVALGFDLVVMTTGVRLPATVWFLGRPVLERESRTVRIEDFDYSVESRASWLDTVNHATLRGALRDQVAPTLVFPFADQADAALQRVRQRPDRRGVSFDLQSLEVSRLGLAEEALVLHANILGTASLTMDLQARGEP